MMAETANRMKVLAVEDDSGHAELIRRAFEYSPLRADLLVAPTLAEARRRLAESPPDVMLVDMLLPDGKGTELLPGNAEEVGFPIVVMTSHGDEQVAVDALKAGALDYVVKTVETLNDIPHIVERTLREWNHILERKEAEAAHRASEERLQSILDNAPTVVYVKDVKGRFLTVNRRFEELFGVRREELLASGTDDTLPDETAELFRHHDESILEEGKPLEFEEKIFQDGDERTYLSVKFPLFGPRGKIHAVGSFSNDITERKQAEEEREILEAQLRQSKKLETIGTLAGGIAHDFNNILSPILGFTEMALEELSPDSQAYADLQHVVTAAERAKDLVQHILVFSRRAEPQRRPIYLGDVLEEAASLLKASLPKTLEIRLDIQTDGGKVKADSTQMLQLVMNLATNAFHAMRDDGHGLLELGLDEIPTDVAQIDLPGERLARLQVRDTGHGIDRDHLERIFDPFFTMKGVQEGTGLGLSVVHGIVMSHGGKIEVESEVGEGTTFKIYLPFTEEETVERDESEVINLGGTERILLVDDEDEVALTARQMLERLGYTVSAWTSPDEAFAAFTDAPDAFDLVLTDQTMPRLTGDRLAAKILEQRPEIPIVLMTGFSEDVTPERCRELGFRAYLWKPIVSREMSRAIREALDGE